MAATAAAPTFRAAPVRVRVPATSANLGPGFDALGLALGLYDDVVAQVTDEPGLRVEVAGEGADERAARRDATSSSRRCAPPSRRLGGAAARPRRRAARTASRTAAASARRPPRSSPASSRPAASSSAARSGSTTPALLELAAALEGHPDNVAACLLGGLTVAWSDDGRRAGGVRCRSHPASHRWRSSRGASASTARRARLLPDGRAARRRGASTPVAPRCSSRR